MGRIKIGCMARASQALVVATIVLALLYTCTAEVNHVPQATTTPCWETNQMRADTWALLLELRPDGYTKPMIMPHYLKPEACSPSGQFLYQDLVDQARQRREAVTP